jgi:hypothetical protein
MTRELPSENRPYAGAQVRRVVGREFGEYRRKSKMVDVGDVENAHAGVDRLPAEQIGIEQVRFTDTLYAAFNCIPVAFFEI